MITYIYYAHLASVRFEHSVCRGSLMTTYIYIYILYVNVYIYIYIYIYIYTKVLLIENVDNEQNNLFKKYSNLNKGRKLLEKVSFLKIVRVLLKTGKYVLNSFKSNFFPIMSDGTLIQHLEKDFFYQ